MTPQKENMRRLKEASLLLLFFLFIFSFSGKSFTHASSGQSKAPAVASQSPAKAVVTQQAAFKDHSFAPVLVLNFLINEARFKTALTHNTLQQAFRACDHLFSHIKLRICYAAWRTQIFCNTYFTELP